MRKVPKSVRKELAELAAKPESEIDFSDLPTTTERDWRGAERGRFYRPVKRQLTVRIDADVLEWLKSNGRGYQSRLNSILRQRCSGSCAIHSGQHWMASPTVAILRMINVTIRERRGGERSQFRTLWVSECGYMAV